MITRNILLRAMFCIGLFLFIFAFLSPWVGKYRLSTFPPHYSGKEIYWSFQAVFYPPMNGQENRLISWDFWFGPHERLLLWDFWFNRDMQFHGLTFAWIHLFVLQLLTIISGIYVLVWKWQEIKYLLIPLFFSILSVVTGLELVSTFMFAWSGYARPYWGLPLFAVPSTFCFFGTFLIRYLGARGRKKSQGI